MGDGLIITHGNALLVDSSMLRQASLAWSQVESRMHRVAAGLQVAGWIALCTGSWHCVERCDEAMAAASAVASDMRDMADRLLTAADRYELAEMMATPEVWQSDPVAQARFTELLSQHSAAVGLLTAMLLTSAKPVVGESFRQQNLASLGVLGYVLNDKAWELSEDTGWGTIESHERLLVPEVPVTLIPLTPTPHAGAPVSVAGALARVPQGDEARIRVERYTLPDGSERFVAYVSGTVGFDSPDAFDMMSNITLYTGLGGTSYSALTAALAAAGAKPGDRVSQFSYSQGAMAAGRLAVEGPYRVDLNVTIGSPVSPVLSPDTLHVDIAHADDLVASLRGQGLQFGQADPDSIVVTRTVSPLPWPPDLGVGAHEFGAYIETAEQFDASPDPRVETVHERIVELDEAVSVDVFEFSTYDGENYQPPPPPLRRTGDKPGGDADG